MKYEEETIKQIIKEETSKLLLPIPDSGRGIYFDYIDESININLNEGLYKTYPPETAKNYIQKLFVLSDGMIRIVSNNGNIPEEQRIQVLFYKGYGNQERMRRAMLLCGYAISKSMRHENDYIEEIYIPINLPNLNDIVKKYDFITHVSTQYFKHKILNIGFVPKSINTMFSYPDRIFFFKGDAPFQEIVYQTMDFDSKNTKQHNNHIYTLYKIDTKRIPNNVNVHTDLTYPYGIYTNENIPKSCIETYRDFDINSFKQNFK